MQGPVTGFHENLHSVSSHKDPHKTLVQTFKDDRGLPVCSMKLLQDRQRRDQERDNRFVRACAVEMHIDISGEHPPSDLRTALRPNYPGNKNYPQTQGYGMRLLRSTFSGNCVRYKMPLHVNNLDEGEFFPCYKMPIRVQQLHIQGHTFCYKMPGCF